MSLVIDCDRDPLILWKGFIVEEHRKIGQIEWNPANMKLLLVERQAHNSKIRGDQLRKELAFVSVANANVLDCLLAHPDLIPGEWGKDEEYDLPRKIFFWGTIYRNPWGLWVRFLDFSFVRCDRNGNDIRRWQAGLEMFTPDGFGGCYEFDWLKPAVVFGR